MATTDDEQQQAELALAEARAAQADARVAQADAQVAQADARVAQADARVAQADAQVAQEDAMVELAEARAAQADARVAQADAIVELAKIRVMHAKRKASSAADSRQGGDRRRMRMATPRLQGGGSSNSLGSPSGAALGFGSAGGKFHSMLKLLGVSTDDEGASTDDAEADDCVYFKVL